MLKLDLSFITLGALAFFILTLIAQINPPAKPDIEQPGNMVVTMAWPEGNTDVDLWLSSPEDEAVGYSKTTGRTGSLLRDDRGNEGDDTPLNFENAYSRGIPNGEYAVNVRCFSCLGPVPVSVDIRLATGAVIWTGVVMLEGNKDEKTAARWRMQDGQVVTGSMSNVFKEMR